MNQNNKNLNQQSANKKKHRRGTMNRLITINRNVAFVILVIQLVLTGLIFALHYLYHDYPYYLYAAIALSAIFATIDFFFVLFYTQAFRRAKGRTEMKAAEIIGNDINEAYNFGQIGLAVCDHNNTIIWVNDFLGGRYKNIVDKNILDVFPGVYILLEKEKSGTVQKVSGENNHIYSAEYLKEARLFIFKDISTEESTKKFSRDQAPVLGYIAIDNYADVQMNLGDEAKFTDMIADVRRVINNFGENYNALMRRIKDDRYLFITTMENYTRMFESKFDIVDTVKETAREKGSADMLTISIGVSFGFPDYAKLAEMANNALDVALSRGGDQTIIQAFSQPIIYLGGKTELLPSRNRVKMRTLSNSFRTILQSHSNVIIMGHGNADFDAIGSCLGVRLLCKEAKIPCKICWEEQLVEEKVRVAVKATYSTEEMNEMFVSLRNVDSLITPKSLLVVCDHCNPRIAMFLDLYRKFESIAILDHHRPADFVYEDPEFNGIDTSASSACELVTFYITYNDNYIPIDSRTATFLLSGIFMDTHSFKEHTSNNTYEAAAVLTKFKGDSALASDFLKEDLQEYRQKISILNNSYTPFNGVLVAVSPDNEIVSNVMVSLVANEALNISGIDCAFCIGRISEHEVKISARSDKSVNVSALMEKLGGGGHLSMAATTFNEKDGTECSVQQAQNKLNLVLKDYLEDVRLSKSTQGA